MSRTIIACGMILGLSGYVVAADTGWGSSPALRAKAVAMPSKTVSGPTVKDIDALQKTVTDAWEKMPLTERRAIFVSAPPENFGSYEERASNIFKPSEKLITYVEPIGYTWKANGEIYEFGVIVDFIVKSAEGKVLAGQEGFARFVKTSRAKLQEFMLTLTLSVDGAPPGNYVLEYKLHDIGSDKTSTFEQPFTIAG